MAAPIRLALVVLAPGAESAERTWPDSRGHEEEAVLEGLRAVKSSEIGARAGVHLGGPDPVAAAHVMAAAAPVGGVWVSKAVERQVPRRFRFREMPVLHASDEALPVYEVVEQLREPGEFGTAEEMGPFLGHAPNLKGVGVMLVEIGGRFAISGPPGSGRARSLRWLRERFRPSGGWVGFGRCDDGAPSPYGAFGEMLRAEASASGFDRWDGERVVAAVRRLGGKPADADVLALSLGLRLNSESDPPPPSPETARTAWIRFLRNLHPRPLLCLEDIDRADLNERLVLDGLAPGGRVSILGTEVKPRRQGLIPQWFLDALDEQAARELAERVGLPAGIPHGGNPMRIEQLAALAVEAGEAEARAAAADAAPLCAAVDARFRAFPADLRGLLSAAAILGRSFWRFALERLLVQDVGDELAAARKAGWILEREGSLMRGDGELLFRHRVLRDAALAALAPVERASLHGAAAAFYQQRAPLAGPATAARAAWHREQAR